MKQNKDQYSQTEKVQVNNYSVDIRMHNGRKHLVVPVIMMVEGVHHGSAGAIFHSAAELGHFPASWNDIPVVIQHPSEDGQSISAKSPDIIEDGAVGRVYNTRFETGKLKAEAWLDEERMGQVSPEALEYIRSNQPLDVSLGMFTDDELVSGNWNGEAYTAISHNHRPDHLALLPGAVGACSWADGCGVRTNQKGGNDVPLLKDGKIDLTDQNITVLKELVVGGYSLIVNETGLRDKIMAIQKQLDGMDNDNQVHFLEEAYASYFVYRRESREGGESALYKQTYSLDKDGIVEFGAQPIPVIRKVKYVEPNNNSDEGGTKKMAENIKPCCPEKVELLIQSELNSYKEGDREWLSTLDEKVVDSFLAMEAAHAELVTQLAAAKEAGETKETVQMNKDQAIQVLKDQLADPQQFMGLLSPVVQAQFRHGQSLYEAHRLKLVGQIMANANPGVFDEPELKKMDTVALEQLARAIPSKVDYSVFGDESIVRNKSEVIPLLPPGVVATV